VKRVLRLVLVVACVPLVSGCFYFPGTFGASGGESAEASAAQANVRGAIPAIEAYYADNNTYSGVTVATLQEYDYGVKDVRIAMANDQTYCVESTAGGETYSKAGPAADILPGPCPPSAPPLELPKPAQSLHAAVRAMETYRLANGTYEGVTANYLERALPGIQGVVVVEATALSFCLEKGFEGTTWIARESGDVGVGAC
jgi:hypothetical protein